MTLLLAASRLIAPLKAWLETTALLDLPAFGFKLAFLYHPGFWLLVTAALAVPILGVGAGLIASVLREAGRKWLVASLAVAGFLLFAQVMQASGMTRALAEAVAAATGPLYVLLLPFVGGLGGFLTASNAGSNAMFAQFQLAVAEALALPAEPVAAAQNAAGANVTLASPGRVVLAATIVGLLGREGALMRPALLVAGAGLAAMSVMLWGWLRWL